MKTNQNAYTTVKYPRIRLLMADGGKLGLAKHTVHGLVEFDITLTHEMIRQYRALTGEALSFTAYFLFCLGRAIDAEKEMHAYRNWRKQLIIFDEIDINMLFEVEVDGQKTILPHILRGVNKRSMREIHDEIQSFQIEHQASEESKFIDRFVQLPGIIRRTFLWALFKTPQMVKDYYGTVMVSSLGMFGKGTGWGIPVPNHTLQLTLGGICEKPGVINHSVEIHKYMSVTISFDHNIIDGAPAARFIDRLKKLIEKGIGLAEIENR